MEEAVICTKQKCEAVIEARAYIDNLVSWQKQQNGAIHEVNSKVNTLNDKLDERFQTLLYWILGTLATVCLSLLGTMLLIMRSLIH